MEVIADGEHGLAGRSGRHGERLQALDVAEGVGDAPWVAAISFGIHYISSHEKEGSRSPVLKK